MYTVYINIFHTTTIILYNPLQGNFLQPPQAQNPKPSTVNPMEKPQSESLGFPGPPEQSGL